MTSNNFKINDLNNLLPPLKSLTSISSSDLNYDLNPSNTSNTTNTTSPSSSSPSSSNEIINFYIILPDSDFNEKVGGLMKKSMLKSELLKGKFQRKLDLVEVLSYSESINDNWLRKLYPGKDFIPFLLSLTV